MASVLGGCGAGVAAGSVMCLVGPPAEVAETLRHLGLAFAPAAPADGAASGVVVGTSGIAGPAGRVSLTQPRGPLRQRIASEDSEWWGEEQPVPPFPTFGLEEHAAKVTYQGFEEKAKLLSVAVASSVDGMQAEEESAETAQYAQGLAMVVSGDQAQPGAVKDTLEQAALSAEGEVELGAEGKAVGTTEEGSKICDEAASEALETARMERCDCRIPSPRSCRQPRPLPLAPRLPRVMERGCLQCGT